jgi:D-glycero-D-manno-heptose 1,7-bisphosphate phosphatase
MKHEKKALFLDRDGIINREINYLIRKEDVVFLTGIFELTAAYQSAGYLLVIITNQAGIGRGYYSEEDFKMLTEWIHGEFRKHGINIAATYHCPYHPVNGIGEYRKESPDRKPNPGMILKAIDTYDIDPGSSMFLGDRDTDMQAAFRAGIGERVLYDPEKRETGEQATRIIMDFSEIMPKPDKDFVIPFTG